VFEGVLGRAGAAGRGGWAVGFSAVSAGGLGFGWHWGLGGMVAGGERDPVGKVSEGVLAYGDGDLLFT